MKQRSDSYEATLSDDERENLHALLLSPGVSLEAARLAVPTWRGGPRDGSRPSIVCLSKIAQRLRLERTMEACEATARVMQAVRGKVAGLALGKDDQEATLDAAMSLIGEEVLERTLHREDPKARTAAARLLLKRADQKLHDRRIKLLEAAAKKAEAAEVVTRDQKLTPEERHARMREIFGLAQ